MWIPSWGRCIEQAAARQGVPVSVRIREAVRRHCDEVLGRTLRSDLGDIIGAVEIGGDQSRRTGQAFTELLHERQRPRQA